MAGWDEPNAWFKSRQNENYWKGETKPFISTDNVDFTKKSAKTNFNTKPSNEFSDGRAEEHNEFSNGNANGHAEDHNEFANGDANGHANGQAKDNEFSNPGGGDDFGNAGGEGDFVGGSGEECRNCGQEGHFARECPEPKKNSGECHNCGETGHNKADCTNPRVVRPFTGTCRLCNQEGHPAAECPDKGPDVCRNCKEEGHKASECEANRALDYADVPDMSSTEAWALLKKASDERDIDDFKTALKAYVKADREATYDDLERKFRQAKFSIYLIALERELPLAMTSVNLQGKSACKYVVGFYYDPKPKRAKFSEGWPSSPEDNIERLQDTGIVMEQVQPLCRNCEQLGHISKNCPEEKIEKPKVEITCGNCNGTGHRQRDCKEPRQVRGACKNCGQPGHKASDCTEPRSAEGVKCRKCNETGHFAKDCPNSQGGGGGSGCRNCGEEGHMAKECDKPKNPDMVTCRNCDKMGHFSRECPEPRDWSRVKCSNCGEMGHTIKRCKAPIAEGGDGGFDNPASGGFNNPTGSGAFDSAAVAEDFGNGGADDAGGATEGDWNAGSGVAAAAGKRK